MDDPFLNSLLVIALVAIWFGALDVRLWLLLKKWIERFRGS